MSKPELERQVEELLLLQRVAQKIGGLLDLDVLLEEIVSDVAQTFGYSRSAVLLIDEKSGEVVIEAVRGWTVNFHQKGERFRIGEYGIVGHVAATGDTYYAPDVLQDLYYQVSEAETRSELDVPLKARGRLIGVFNVQHTETNAFPPSRIAVIEALAVHVAIAIDNAQLFGRERFEKKRMQQELNEAQTIQRALFPDHAPAIPNFALDGVCLPCRAVGGDWYDYIPLPDGRMAVVVADISGKGTSAALLMSSTRSILRQVAMNAASPSIVMQEVNEILLHDFPHSRFVTMVYVLLDPRERSLKFASAGHPPPLLVCGDEATFVQSETGVPLGIHRGLFTEQEVSMQPGTRLLMYSDGVLEAESPDGDEYGFDRIREQVAPKTSTIEILLRDVRRFSGELPLTDDATAVMIQAV